MSETWCSRLIDVFVLYVFCTRIFHCTALLCYFVLRPQNWTRHRVSTSMYSQTFSIRILLPERHQWKPAVQTGRQRGAFSTLLRQSPASDPRPLPIYGAQFGERPPSSASQRPAARRPRPAGRSHYVVISRDGRKLVTRVRVMLP